MKRRRQKAEGKKQKAEGRQQKEGFTPPSFLLPPSSSFGVAL